MKYKMRSIAVLISFIFGFLIVQKFEEQIPSIENKTSNIEEKLYKKVAQLEPHSNEAYEIKRALKKLKNLRKGDYITQENPGALIEAFREIKISFDGSTYKPDYKLKEYEKAKKSNDKFFKASPPLPWTERGPGNISGRTQQVLVDPDDVTGDTWFAATVGGGIWKTTNAGQSWQNKTPALSTLSTTCIAISHSNTNIMYAGTGMGFGRLVDLAGNGVWKSTDHGENWFQLQSTANNELLAAINRIVVDPNDENILLVCSNDDFTSYGPNGGSRISGIFRSTDGGSTWLQTYDPDIELGTTTDNRIQQIVATPGNFNILYASVNEVGVIKSTDAGITWSISADNFARPQDIGTANGTYQGISTRTELAIAPTDPNRIYAAVERRLGIAKLYMSTNAGTTWSLVNDTGNDPNWFNAFGASGATGAYTAGWFDNTIAVSPYDENVVFVGGVEIYRINVNPGSNSRTTTRIGSRAVVHADHHDLKMIPVDQASNSFKILNANDGGVALSNDGGNTWQQITGIISTQFYGSDKKPGENAYIGGMQDNGTFQSPVNSAVNSQWFRQLGGDGFESAWNYSDESLLLGGSQNGVYSRSTDGGVTWYPIPDAKAGPNAPFITKIATSKIDPDLVFTIGTGGVKRSDDFGSSWTLTPISGNWIGWRAFDNVEISLADPQNVWITSRLDLAPYVGQQGGIHVSSDAGLSFTEISSNFPLTVTEASGIGTHPVDLNTAYILFSAAGTPKILQTTDLGNSWEDISGFSPLPGKLNSSKASENYSSNGFPDVAVYSILVMPYNTNIIWAGTEIGLFESTDNGSAWHLAENGFPDVGIFQMFIQDEQIVVSTYGRGIWTVNPPGLSGYAPPAATLSPRLNQLAQTTAGDLSIKIDLRSSYDSTQIFIDGEYYQGLAANTLPLSNEILYPVTEEKTVSVNVKAYKGARQYQSPTRSLTVFPIQAQGQYTNDFSTANSINDFVGNGFTISTPSNFSNPCLNSNHPYGTSEDFIMKIKIPIVVSSTNSFLEYDDVVLVEPGIASIHTDPNFFDYVIVEASLDGISWTALLDGYDSRSDQQWLNSYNSGIVGNDSNTPGDDTMYRNHRINFLDKFSANDVIFIRFRLSSDPLAVGWGWAIDNVNIQNDATLGINSVANTPNSYYLEQNFPNPFNPSTIIRYNLIEGTNVKLNIFNSLGEKVKTLVNEIQNPGLKEITWNGSNDLGATVSSGVYFYKIETINFTQSKKMILLK